MDVKVHDFDMCCSNGQSIDVSNEKHCWYSIGLYMVFYCVFDLFCLVSALVVIGFDFC